jgi:hypothetical protein
MGSKAFHGIAGKIALAVGEKTEADSRGILVGFLVGVGNVIDRRIYCQVNDTRHYTNNNAVLVGSTAIARKSMSANIVEEILRMVDSEWATRRIARGFSSGEGLLHYVRDPRIEPVKVSKKGEEPQFEHQVVDPGVEDKRCLCRMNEFGELLTMILRDGSILSGVLRDAWDGISPMQINTRKIPICVTNAHISILGAITREELLKLIVQIPNYDGFINRFLWCLIECIHSFPHGGPRAATYLSKEIEQVRRIVQVAGKGREIVRSEDADDLWEELYGDFRKAKVRPAVSRAESHVLRTSIVFAVLDNSKVIERKHIEAARALWDYCHACAVRLFQTEEYSLDAQKILDYLQEKGPEGATRSDLSSRVFSHHRTHKEIIKALAEVKDLTWSKSEPTEGRYRERWFAYPKGAGKPKKK